MKALIERLRDRSVTLTIYNYEGSEGRLDRIGASLAAKGVAVRTDETGEGTPAGFGVFHRDDDVFGAVSVDEQWPEDGDFETLFAEGAAADGPELPILPTDETAVSPETSRERMVGISRNIERTALREGAGRLISGFQDLSVLVGSERTRSVYGRLKDAGVDATVVGYPDADLEDLGFHVFEDGNGTFRDYWFMLYDGNGNDGRKAALVSEQADPSLYDSFWTEDPDVVDDLFSMAREEYTELF